jgi:hypothetical protein
VPRGALEIELLIPPHVILGACVGEYRDDMVEDDHDRLLGLLRTTQIALSGLENTDRQSDSSGGGQL